MEKNLQLALEANRAAYDALRTKLHVGMTERDAYRIVSDAVDSVCGGETHEFIGDFVGGARSGAIEGPATDYAFRPGDTFILDLSVRRGEIWSDTCRTFFFGNPSDRQRHAYDTIIAVQDFAFGLVRAGVVVETVKEKAEAFLAERGYAGKMPHHVGHRVGPKPYMKPAFELGDKTKLESGWCVTLEPGLYFENEFGIRVENDYFVGDDGLTNLFEYPRNLEAFIVSIN